MTRKDNPEFDVCLSFAGEDRSYVRDVAKALRQKGIRVFFDEYQEIDLWGKDLYEHLDDVYKHSAHYCVIFASKYYANKLWSNHERRSAQERALKENREYILPARFDKTPIPGLRETVGYINLEKHSAGGFAELIRKKVGGHYRNAYVPPVPDRLFERLGITAEDAKEKATATLERFLWTLKRMAPDERRLVFHLVQQACPAELPENIHVNIDLLRRVSGFPPSKIRRLLSRISSLGFTTRMRIDDETLDRLGKEEMLVLEWQDFSLDGGNNTEVVRAMILGAADNYCEEHGMEALERLDFSQLASSTSVKDVHRTTRAPSQKTAANKRLQHTRSRARG
jgi:hypothetical protein